MNPILAHDLLTHDNATDPSPERWVVFLHGIFGQGRNWHSLAKQLIEKRPDLGAVLVDLREHGRSVGFDPPHNVDTVTKDVAALVEHLSLGDHAIVGHSFGGKVALRYAADAPNGLSAAVIVDSTPAAVAAKNQGAMMLELLRRLPDRFADREEAVQGLASFGVSPSVGRWMATNLVRDTSPDASAQTPLVWRFSLDDIATMLGDFYPAEFWYLTEAHHPPVPLRFLRASQGSLLSDEAADRIAAAPTIGDRIQLHKVEGDHWLNVSNPGGVIDHIIAAID